MKSAKMSGIVLAVAAAGMASMSVARADEAQAKSLLRAMSDYLAAQKTISFDYDTNLELVTTQQQKIGLASSGTLTFERPDKLHATRSGGFANLEMVFDGKTLNLLGKNANVYTQIEAPGTIDHLVDELRDKYHRPVPAADLLMSDPYKELMPPVTDVKDLGSGVIRGIECDHLAFRTKEVDWQIWIAQGARPYPCRYVITSKKVKGSPQYTLDVRAWKAGRRGRPGCFQTGDSAKRPESDAGADPQSQRHSRPFQGKRSKVTMFRRIGVVFLAVIVWCVCLELGEQFAIPGLPGFVSPAEAVVGRPLTPVSYAGVARRTSRRCAAGAYC